jgi:hypothetical protein
MRRHIAAVVAGLLFCGAQAFAQGAGSGPVAKARATTPEIPFEVVPNLYRFPDGLYMGEGIGVSTNSKGHLFLFTRSGESRVFEFDKAGNFVKEFGKDSYGYGFAHAVHVDRYDNVWTVDEGSNLLIKYAPDGKLLMVLGKHPDPIDQLGKMPGTAPWSGANRPYSFHRPTDFGWDKDDNIYLSDGYTDARIVKFDKNGRFIKSAGKRGNPANPLEFAAPHTMAVDADGNVYVGDRGNSRVVVLDKAVGGLRHPRARRAVPLRLELGRNHNRAPLPAHHRRDLQDEARRHGARPLRQGRRGARGIREHPPAGLPLPERDLHRRDPGLAHAKSPAEAIAHGNRDEP